MNDILTLPSYDSFMNPMLDWLHESGGSSTIEEMVVAVGERINLTDAQMQILHDNKTGRTELEYRLAWTRTYLKQYGILENSARGVWSLTSQGKHSRTVEPKEVVRHVGALNRKGRSSAASEDPTLTDTQAEVPTGNPDEPIEIDWRAQALEAVQAMSPAGFERLSQRLLRESGFIQVEVTGKSGDGGIDGKGILRIGGLLSFHVSFQCKRWQGVVGSAAVREFRGSMIGRADKGLIITTSTFTRDAIREATRDGAPAIDLIDGQQLVEKLKELGLGVSTRRIEVEAVEVDADWFLHI